MKKPLILLLALLCFFPANAQESRLALVIGNGNYINSILANPENDARALEIALGSIGFEVMKYENLGQKEMRQAIDDFGNRLNNYDMGLFFFAGHGIQANGFNYLIPVDASLKSESDVEYNCVRADRVLGKMEYARNGVNLVILDACRDNPFERSWTRAAKGRGFAMMSAPVGSVVAFATSPGKTASDGAGENSPYTSGLLEYLSEPGITVIQMFQKVTAFVHNESDGVQLPWVSTSLMGDVYLATGSAIQDNTMAVSHEEAVTSRPDKIPVRPMNDIAIAVLPFKDYTGKSEQDWFVESQQETLITELSKLSQHKSLRVIRRGSVNEMRYFDRSVAEVAKEHDIDFLVEGSVMSLSDSVMLTVHLIQAFPEEKIVWSESFVNDMPNILRLHSSIAGQIARNTGLEFSPEERNKLPEARVVNPDVYDAVVRGQHYLKDLTEEGRDKGLEFLHQAVDLDPADPNAWASLALGYHEIAHGPLDPGGSLEKAEYAALQALKLDSTLAVVHAALAEVYFYQTYEYGKALKFFHRALELDPNLALTRYHYSWLLYVLGDMDEAIEQHILSKKYDPFDPAHTSWLGGLYCYDGKYEAAIREAKEALKIERYHPVSFYVLGRAYLALGRTEEAIEAHEMLYEIFPVWPWPLCETYVKTGQTEKAEALVEELEGLEVTPFDALNLTIMYSALGRLDDAYKWLNHEPHHSWTAGILVMPEFENLRKDPRFETFKERVTYPE